MSNKIYIFGAHSRARTTAYYLECITPGLEVLAYIVDNDEENPKSIDNTPVIHLSDCDSTSLDVSCPIYLGIRGVFHQDIKRKLELIGFTNIIPITPDIDTKIRTKYLKKRFEEEGRSFVKIDDLTLNVFDNVKGISSGSGCIYEVKSVYDKPLSNDVYKKQSYEKTIQVGTALTERIPDCEFYDNEGDNISSTNRQLCEETGLYWIWKHASEDYVGLVHYRRHFILPDDWLARIERNKVDVILPLPIYVAPNVEDNYRFRHVSEDWDIVKELVMEDGTFNEQQFEQCFKDTLYYPCNMFIMKKEILDEFASWMFPILFKMIEEVGVRDDVYQNRYSAFMAERLLTLFFKTNKSNYNIVFADKNFLQ